MEIDYYDRYFSAYTARPGFTWVPTLPAFEAAGSSADLFFRLDGHLTVAGNALLARQFLDSVMPKLGPSPTPSFGQTGQGRSTAERPEIGR